MLTVRYLVMNFSGRARHLFTLWFSIAVLLHLTSCSPNKVVEEFNEKGTLVASFSVNKKSGLKEGTYLGYLDTGELFEESQYVDDQLHGLRTIFSKFGSKLIEEHYIYGVMDGFYREFYEDGTLKHEGKYVSNEMTGQWKKFYPNGQLMEDVQFVKSEENGPFIEYFENGKLKAKGAYKDGDNEHGPLEIYNSDGLLVRKMDCEIGICRTTWKSEKISN